MPEPITNFGRNLSFSPEHVFTPEDEDALLDILGQYRGRPIRTVGRLHSWSEAPVGEHVLLDLRRFDFVRLEPAGEDDRVTVGAGCQIKRLLAELERQAGVTLPSVGLIAEQSIAGAVSTGTHGSGKNSLSHYVDEVRVATYDPTTGQPVIRVISDGPELRAARCCLGTLGVIVSLGIQCRPRFQVEEHFRTYEDLADVLAAESDFPLQQFFLIPWRWRYIVQHRREVTEKRSWLATLYRWYVFATFDLGLHLIVLLLARIFRGRRGPRFVFRRILPLTVIHNWRVVDLSWKMLVMKHDLFRHIEIEIFVKQSRLAGALTFVTELLSHFSGDRESISASFRARLAGAGLDDDLKTRRGTYTHHYPICVRRVLPDATLISMAAGDGEPFYAISFISYARPSQRETFMQFADHLCRAMAVLFDGRPHWGKVCPLTAAEATRLYPELPRFREICAAADPAGVFRNDWVNRLLFPEPQREGSTTQTERFSKL